MELAQLAELRARMATRRVRGGEVAAAMGMTPAHFSKILNGHIPAPADFEARFEDGFKLAVERRVNELTAA